MVQPEAQEVGVTDLSSTEYGTQPYDILEVKDLRVYYDTPRGAVKAVDGMNFTLKTEERLGLAGESGSGKSTMAKALMRLIKQPGRIVGGEVWLDGRDVLKIPEDEMARLRLAEISMIAQGAQNSLNPVARVRPQITDAIAIRVVETAYEDLIKDGIVPPGIAICTCG